MNFESALISQGKKPEKYGVIPEQKRLYKILKPFRPQKGGL